mmetsp:Transcript_19202/g.55753  ORF Transcript_19202/g.55753 Transcript_19202/m.55753 type:complete len:327 (+) Transcript_19202:1323-2303(+)
MRPLPRLWAGKGDSQVTTLPPRRPMPRSGTGCSRPLGARGPRRSCPRAPRRPRRRPARRTARRATRWRPAASARSRRRSSSITSAIRRPPASSAKPRECRAHRHGSARGWPRRPTMRSSRKARSLRGAAALAAVQSPRLARMPCTRPPAALARTPATPPCRSRTWSSAPNTSAVSRRQSGTLRRDRRRAPAARTLLRPATLRRSVARAPPPRSRSPPMTPDQVRSGSSRRRRGRGPPAQSRPCGTRRPSRVRSCLSSSSRTAPRASTPRTAPRRVSPALGRRQLPRSRRTRSCRRPRRRRRRLEPPCRSPARRARARSSRTSCWIC